jgi:murein DD-endopeptidase MepM/ murein hydrolase activator NlpD
MRRGIALVVSVSLIVGALVTVAHAASSLDRARKERKLVVRRLEKLHEARHDGRVRLNQRMREITIRLHHSVGPAAVGDRHRWERTQARVRGQRHEYRLRLKGLVRYARRRAAALRLQRQQLTDWIQTYGIFRRCPVAGPHEVMDNFGVWVIKPDVPKHIHQGNDIIAASGTPIVAPFDGVAVASPNTLGGLAVKVFGELGFVYNAHLSAYAHLGKVKAGEVIGYVGSTGDAGGPHDHFEWHPENGSAVDPNTYLSAVC